MTTDQSRLSHLRLLVLAPTHSSTPSTSKPSPFPPLLELLTSSAPSEDITSFAGYTSHPPLHLKTKYYEKDVSIWCDELPLAIDPNLEEASAVTSGDAPTLSQWKEQMSSDAAREVRDVIGGTILVLPIQKPNQSPEMPNKAFGDYIQAVHAFREAIEDESGGRDVASVIVLQPVDPSATSNDANFIKQLDQMSAKVEEWCHDQAIFGWDFVSWDARVAASRATVEEETNEYGEKLGMERVKEVLEAVDWSVGPSAEFDDLDGDDVDILSDAKFKGLDSELQHEIMGLKLSMMDNEDQPQDEDGEDVSADEMQELMSRVVAIRDAGVDLPKEERQAFAKREVEKIIRELS